MLQVRSVFSKYCCLSVKLRGFITPLEEQAPFEWLISGPTLPFDTWHSLQPLLCSPFPAREIFTAAVPAETLGQHLCSPLFWFTALTSGIKKQSAREILAPVKLMAKLPPCSKKGDYARWVELDLRKVRFGAGVAPLWPDFCVWEGVLAVPELCKKASGTHRAAPQNWCLLFTLQSFEAVTVYLYLLFLPGGCWSLVIDASGWREL